jgi:hypothetical protein
MRLLGQTVIRRSSLLVLTLLVLLVTAAILYHRVFIAYSLVPGYYYGDNLYEGGQYEIYTLKYYYVHQDHYYFDHQDHVIETDISIGDSIDIRVFDWYPKKHAFQRIKLFHSNQRYNSENGFETRYHAHINTLKDYYPKDYMQVETPGHKQLIYPSNMTVNQLGQISNCIDRIHFNKGSLIHRYVVSTSADTIKVYLIYHYLNRYSVDALPGRVLVELIKSEFPNYQVHVSALDMNQAKRERLVLGL